MDDRDFLLPEAAALRFGISEIVIHVAIDRGELRTVVYRGGVRIPVQALRDFKRRLEGDEGSSSAF